MSDTLSNSTKDQVLLRPIASWAANYVEQVLPVFEKIYPDEPRPRQAVKASREFGKGKRRDNNLRLISMAVFKLGKITEGSPKYVTRAASAVAAIAYTHTDLTEGVQGMRQARHILGPVVYAALSLGEDSSESEELINDAIATAPPEVNLILQHMPTQSAGKKQEDLLFARLDISLRSKN